MRGSYLLCLSLALVSACAFTREPDVAEEMLKRASALTKLTAAVESHIRFGKPLARATDAELLAEATAHDPALLTNLGDYKLRVLNRNRHAVILVCTQDGSRALLEDVGCSGKMDIHHWETRNVPCEFTATVETTCGL